MSEKFIYETHPVTAERKAELRQKGYKILDASFAPDDYEHPEPVKVGTDTKARGKGGAPSIEELRTTLTANGVTFDEKAKKPELQKLLDDFNAIAELKGKLTEKGVQFEPAANLEDLQKLLGEAA